MDFFDSISFQTAAYKYNCFGQRIEKTSDSGTVDYYYDGSQLVEERTNGFTAATYVWGRSGELLTMARSGQNYYYHGDDLGSIRAVTDASGARVETYTFSDLGQPGFFNGSFIPLTASAIQNPWLYFTHQFDPESGLYILADRYLDTLPGRYTTRVSPAIWDSDSPLGNPFTFDDDNPVTPFMPPHTQERIPAICMWIPGRCAKGCGIGAIQNATKVGITISPTTTNPDVEATFQKGLGAIPVLAIFVEKLTAKIPGAKITPRF